MKHLIGIFSLLFAGASLAATPTQIDLTKQVRGVLPAANTETTAVTPGSYGDSTNVGTFTVDSHGRLTAAANVAIGAASILPRADAGGTAQEITATFSPAITLTDKMIVAVVSAAVNTATDPTFSPNGLTAHVIYARGGESIAVGDTGSAGYVMLLEYNLAGTYWELMNPARSINPYPSVISAAAYPIFVDANPAGTDMNQLPRFSSGFTYNAGTGVLATSQFQSTATLGTPPFVVASATEVANLTAANATLATTAGTATALTTANDTTTATATYPIFSMGIGGSYAIRTTDSKFQWFPATGILGTTGLTTGSIIASTGVQLTYGTATRVPYLDGSKNLVDDISLYYTQASATLSAGNFSGSGSGLTSLPLSGHANQAANTIVGNATSGSAAPTALAVGSCSTSGSALIWTSNSGFGCNTSIVAASATGNAGTATALATGRTIGMTGDVTWTSASFDGTGNVTGTSAIGETKVTNAMLNADVTSSAHTWSGSNWFTGGLRTDITLQGGTTYTMDVAYPTVQWNGAVNHTVTLPTASSYEGMVVEHHNFTAQTVVSASSNVVDLAGNLTTNILGANIGEWARLQSDGSNWKKIAGSTSVDKAFATDFNGTIGATAAKAANFTTVGTTGNVTITKATPQFQFIATEGSGVNISMYENAGSFNIDALGSQTLVSVNGGGSGTTITGNVTASGFATGATTVSLLQATATTINFGGAATTINAGAATGTFTVANTTLAAKAGTFSTTLGVTAGATFSGANLTVPVAKFQYSAAGGPMSINAYNVQGYPYLAFNALPVASSDNSTYSITGLYASKLDMSGGGFKFEGTATAGTAGNTITWSPILKATNAGLIGIGTTAPGKALEINSPTGANLRLTYNDSDGSAANYADLQSGTYPIASGTYTSGLTVTGSTGDTVVLYFTNGGGIDGYATVALTGTDTIAGGTALVIQRAGYGFTSAPTTASATAGTASSASGTATVSTALGTKHGLNVTAAAAVPSISFAPGSGGYMYAGGILVPNQLWVGGATSWVAGAPMYEDATNAAAMFMGSPAGIKGGLFAGSRTSDADTGAQAVNANFMMLHDKTGGANTGYAIYSESWATAAATVQALHGYEMAIINLNTTPVVTDPYNTEPAGLTEGLRLGAGKPASGSWAGGGRVVSTALSIINVEASANARFGTGIVFADDALTSDNLAISLGSGHKVTWYSATNTTDTYIYNNNGGLQFIGGNTSARPTSTNTVGGLNINWNYGGVGSKQIDFWNTYDSAGSSFIFRQKTGAASHTDLVTFGGTGAIQLHQVNTSGATRYLCISSAGVLSAATSC